MDNLTYGSGVLGPALWPFHITGYGLSLFEFEIQPTFAGIRHNIFWDTQDGKKMFDGANVAEVRLCVKKNRAQYMESWVIRVRGGL